MCASANTYALYATMEQKIVRYASAPNVRGVSTKRRPWLGVMGLLDYDLFRETESVTYSPNGGFSQTTVRHELGQLTYGILVMVGWEVDLTPY